MNEPKNYHQSTQSLSLQVFWRWPLSKPGHLDADNRSDCLREKNRYVTYLDTPVDTILVFTNIFWSPLLLLFFGGFIEDSVKYTQAYILYTVYCYSRFICVEP